MKRADPVNCGYSLKFAWPHLGNSYLLSTYVNACSYNCAIECSNLAAQQPTNQPTCLPTYLAWLLESLGLGGLSSFRVHDYHSNKTVTQ